MQENIKWEGVVQLVCCYESELWLFETDTAFVWQCQISLSFWHHMCCIAGGFWSKHKQIAILEPSDYFILEPSDDLHMWNWCRTYGLFSKLGLKGLAHADLATNKKQNWQD